MTKEEKQNLEKNIRKQCWIRDTNGTYGLRKEIPFNGFLFLQEGLKYCSFYNIFSIEEKEEFNQFLSTIDYSYIYIDWVHIFGRGRNKLILEKTCLGNRVSHSFFDEYRNPYNGKKITKEERAVWQDRLYKYVKSKNYKERENELWL